MCWAAAFGAASCQAASCRAAVCQTATSRAASCRAAVSQASTCQAAVCRTATSRAASCRAAVYRASILDFQCPSKILCHTSNLWNFVKITGPLYTVQVSPVAATAPVFLCGKKLARTKWKESLRQWTWRTKKKNEGEFIFGSKWRKTNIFVPQLSKERRQTKVFVPQP
jgi:hypothetical protein